ncbi:hypothetical protein HDU96_000344 [Phlyctochytrium bullatum]|nr:hypothetical protein HDU96_000344 [Phlyctochytrium bullatum]
MATKPAFPMDPPLPVSSPPSQPTPTLWTILGFQLRLLGVAVRALAYAAVLGWAAQVLATVLCRVGPVGALPRGLDPAIASFALINILWDIQAMRTFTFSMVGFGTKGVVCANVPLVHCAQNGLYSVMHHALVLSPVCWTTELVFALLTSQIRPSSLGRAAEILMTIPTRTFHNVLWTYIIIDGESPATRLGNEVSFSDPEVRKGIQARSRRMLKERGVCRFRFNGGVSPGSLLMQTLSLSIVSFIMNAMVTGAIHLTLSSVAGTIAANLLLPVSQALMLYMCWPLKNSESLWAAKQFAYATVQFPLKPVSVLLPHPISHAAKPPKANWMLWGSLVAQVLLERLFPRAIDALIRRAEARAAKAAVHADAPPPNSIASELPVYAGPPTRPPHPAAPSIAPTTITTAPAQLSHLTRRVLSLMSYTSSRNDLTLSNYISTLSGLLCSLGPSPFGVGGEGPPGDLDLRTSAPFARVAEGADPRMALAGWRERVVVGMMTLGMEVVVEAVIVAVEARAGVPVESAIPALKAMNFNIVIKHMQNCLAAYSAVHGTFA